MKNQKLLIVCLIIIILASVITNIYILSSKEEKEEFKIDGINIAENENILNDASVSNLDITNVSLLTSDGISSYTAEVTNNTNNEVNLEKLYVVFYEAELEIKVLALSNITLKPNDTTYINITSEADLSKTTEIKYITE